MRHILTILIGILIGHFAFATGQVPDYLIYRGDTIAIFSNPLEQYFEQTGKRELPDFSGCGSTACWRGYKAIWELKNDSLFLRQITSCHNKCGLEIRNANLEKMFGTNDVFASWFTGQIIAPKGKLVQYIHMGYGSVYEEEQIFKLNKGQLKSIKVKSNKKLTDKIYSQKKNWELTKLSLDTIFYHIKNNIDWEQLDKGQHMCDDEYILTFNRNGKIKQVKFKPTWSTKKEKREDWWYNFTERKCRHKLKNSIKNLRLDYLIPEKRFKIEIQLFYDSKEKKLELRKPYGLEDKE